MSTLKTTDPDTFEFLAGFDTHRHLGGQGTPYHRRDHCREIADDDPVENFLFSIVNVCGLGLFSRVIDIANTKELIADHRGLFFHIRNINDETPVHDGWPQVLVAVVLTPATKLDDLRQMFENPLEWARPFALKIFPAFRSPHGIDDYDDPEFQAIMEYAQEMGIPVICHTEDESGSLVAMAKFSGLVKRCPGIKFVLAHMTNLVEIESVRELNASGYKVLGQINPQHALHTEADYLQDGLIANPFLYMNPPFGSKTDAFWAMQMMLTAEPCFALGSDSVAKTIESKQSAIPSAGIYWPPEVLYSVLISAFEQNGDAFAGSWRAAFNRFIRQNAENFFGLEPVWQDWMTVRCVRQPWTVPEYYPEYPGLGEWQSKCVVPYAAGTKLDWKVDMED